MRGSNTSPADPTRPLAARRDPTQAIGVTGLHAICIEQPGPTGDTAGGLVHALRIGRHAAGAVEATAAHLALRRDGQHIVFLDAVAGTTRQTVRRPGRDTPPCRGETSPGAPPVNVVDH